MHLLGEKGCKKIKKEAARKPEDARGTGNPRTEETEINRRVSKATRGRGRQEMISAADRSNKQDESKRPAPYYSIVEQGLHPHSGPKKKEPEIESVIWECANITSMDKNSHFILNRARTNAITTVQEHKLKNSDVKKYKDIFKEAKLKLIGGPSDDTTKTPSAGVGIAAREDITCVRDEFKSQAFKRIYELGRADKYLIDLGWRQNIVAFVVYCFAGGSNEAKEGTDQIADAIREEIGEDSVMPVIIQGDFNRTLNEIPTFKEMIEEEAWVDIGSVASWWGGTDNQTTCQSSSKAKATRIDGMLFNKFALPLVQHFEVIKDDMIPTHSVMRVTLSRQNVQKEKTFYKQIAFAEETV